MLVNLARKTLEKAPWPDQLLKSAAGCATWRRIGNQRVRRAGWKLDGTAKYDATSDLDNKDLIPDQMIC